jgi:hypothetical protein
MKKFFSLKFGFFLAQIVAIGSLTGVLSGIGTIILFLINIFSTNEYCFDNFIYIPIFLGMFLATFITTLIYREKINYLSCLLLFVLIPSIYLITLIIAIIVSVIGLIGFIYYYSSYQHLIFDLEVRILILYFCSFLIIVITNRLTLAFIHLFSKSSEVSTRIKGIITIIICILAINYTLPAYNYLIIKIYNVITEQPPEYYNFIKDSSDIIAWDNGDILGVNYPYSTYFDFKTKNNTKINSPEFIQKLYFGEPVKL